MEYKTNPAAIEHWPVFITPPGSPDYLFYGILIFMVAAVVFVGNLYFQLHALPERMSHRANKVQLEFVAVLCLIALFTHEHIFWIAALLLALVEFPDFSTPIQSIAGSLDRIARSAAGAPPRATAEPVEVIVEPAEAAPRRPHPVDSSEEPVSLAGIEPAPKAHTHHRSRKSEAQT